MSPKEYLSVSSKVASSKGLDSYHRNNRFSAPYLHKNYSCIWNRKIWLFKMFYDFRDFTSELCPVSDMLSLVKASLQNGRTHFRARRVNRRWAVTSNLEALCWFMFCAYLILFSKSTLRRKSRNINYPFTVNVAENVIYSLLAKEKKKAACLI